MNKAYRDMKLSRNLDIWHKKLKRYGMPHQVTVVISLLLLCVTVVLLRDRLILSFDPNFFSRRVDIYLRARPDDTDEQNTPALLTLFTTFKDTPSMEAINTNTIRAWSKLKGVVPVMYYSSSDSPYLSEQAKTHGWKVYEAPRLRNGIPVLKEMFQHAVQTVLPSTMFTAFANADILFDDSLYQTLTLLSKMNDSFLEQRGLFVSGRRIPKLYTSLTIEEDTPLKFDLPLNLNSRSYDKIYALDYFVYLSSRIPFANMPDFVVGKVGFDNWLATKAIEWNMITVDSSYTVVAIHQVATLVYREDGWLSKNACMNRDLVDPFDYDKGRTICFVYYTRSQRFPYVTEHEEADTLDLYRRHKRVAPCDMPLLKHRLLPKTFSTCADFVDLKRSETLDPNYVI